MKYMFLIYKGENTEPNPGTPEFGDLVERYEKFSKNAAEAGIMHGGAPLAGIETATTVRVRNGKTSFTDGPFAETREILGGYYILDCKDLAEAKALAEKIPTAEYGSVEIREVLEM